MREGLENTGRVLLEQWKEAKPTNYYGSNPNLAEVLKTYAGLDAAAEMEPRLRDFGGVVGEQLEALVADCERLENLPVLRAWSGIGERTEEIEFHPSYIEAGRLVWRSGLVALHGQPGRAFEGAALFYLLCHQGEGGHACPVACSAGLVRALLRHGPESLRQRFLPALLETDYDAAAIGAQYLTEVQGGSDVGANVVGARPDPEQAGRWLITGEKWFCSVANADQFLVSARVGEPSSGTAGLGTFLVPRYRADGTLNTFRIRRLKTKLGTRAMASGEIDFEGAQAYPIGEPSEGFKIAVGVVLNCSRWVNALGSAAIMRRAFVEALSYAAYRPAFGHRILEYPMVRETLATMKCEEAAALASTFYLTGLIDRIDTDRADEHERAMYRFLVNANKYITSTAATEVCRAAVEVLGGNGTIEDFSPVPRLLRDNLVFESWEGTHNVLVDQVRRDAIRLGLLDEVIAEIDAALTASGRALPEEAAALRSLLGRLHPRIARSLAESSYGAVHFRRQLTKLTRLLQAARLIVEADAEAARGGGAGKSDVAAHFVRSHLLDAYDPEADEGFSARIARILAEELSACDLPA